MRTDPFFKKGRCAARMGGSGEQAWWQVVGAVPAGKDKRSNRSDVAVYGEWIMLSANDLMSPLC